MFAIIVLTIKYERPLGRVDYTAESDYGHSMQFFPQYMQLFSRPSQMRTVSCNEVWQCKPKKAAVTVKIVFAQMPRDSMLCIPHLFPIISSETSAGHLVEEPDKSQQCVITAFKCAQVVSSSCGYNGGGVWLEWAKVVVMEESGGAESWSYGCLSGYFHTSFIVFFVRLSIDSSTDIFMVEQWGRKG